MAEDNLIEFSAQQQAVLDFLVQSNESVVLTGLAGTGKSTVLRAFQEDNPNRQRTCVAAPTGVAALNVGGMTIHRLFGLGLHFDPRKAQGGRMAEVLRNTHTIIVDEMSMVRCDVAHAMDTVLRNCTTRPGEPFGGVRMIWVGDFYQLPPVVRTEEKKLLKAAYGTVNGWLFESPHFKHLSARTFNLTETFRQKDPEWIAALNAVRDAVPAAANNVNRFVNASEPPPEAPYLCCFRKDADARNAQALAELGAPIATLHPDQHGDTAKIPKDLLEPISIAEGARVMTTRNAVVPFGDTGAPAYVNGSLGFVEKIDDLGVRVAFDKGGSYRVQPVQHEVFEYGNAAGEIERKVVASTTQYPLVLGYAITIHKSQGCSFDSAIIDLGRGAFAHGQLYVALSRIRSPAGFYCTRPVSRADMILDAAVPRFLKASAQSLAAL